MKEGWTSKKLKDICIIRPPKKEVTGKINPNTIVSFAPMEDLGINQKYLQPTKEKQLSEVSGSYTYFSNNDVLLAKVTPCFENGKVGIARDLKNSIGFGSSEYIVYRPKEGLLSEYLYYFLNQASIRKIGEDTMDGSVGLKRIQKIFYEETEIPLPPLSEQKEIVALLDDVLSRIDKARENIEKNIENADELYQSKLEEIFSKSGTEWDEVPLEKYHTFIDYRGRTPEKTTSGIRLITAKNVKLGYLKREPEEFIAEDKYEEWMRRGIPEFGDVIFTTEAPLGNVAQIDTTEKVVFAQRIIVLHPDRRVYNPAFLKYCLLAPIIRKRIFDNETGATVTGIKAKLLKKVLIPCPSLIVQQEIVAELDALEKQRTALTELYTKKLQALDELRNSILEKAFKGELT